jgi:hypothetical protein
MGTAPRLAMGLALVLLSGCAGSNSPSPSHRPSATGLPSSTYPTGTQLTGHGSAHVDMTGDTTGTFDLTFDGQTPPGGSASVIGPDEFFLHWDSGTAHFTLDGKPGFTGEKRTYGLNGYLQLEFVVPPRYSNHVVEIYRDSRGACVVTLDELVAGRIRGSLVCDDMGSPPYLVDVNATFEAEIDD